MRILDNLKSDNIEVVKMTLRLLNVEEGLIEQINPSCVTNINKFFNQGFCKFHLIFIENHVTFSILNKITYLKHSIEDKDTIIDKSVLTFIKLKEVNYD